MQPSVDRQIFSQQSSYDLVSLVILKMENNLFQNCKINIYLLCTVCIAHCEKISFLSKYSYLWSVSTLIAKDVCHSVSAKESNSPSVPEFPIEQDLFEITKASKRPSHLILSPFFSLLNIPGPYSVLVGSRLSDKSTCYCLQDGYLLQNVLRVPCIS